MRTFIIATLVHTSLFKQCTREKNGPVGFSYPRFDGAAFCPSLFDTISFGFPFPNMTHFSVLHICNKSPSANVTRCNAEIFGIKIKTHKQVLC